MTLGSLFVWLTIVSSPAQARSDGSVFPDASAGTGFDCGQCHKADGVKTTSFLDLAPPERRPRISIQAEALPLQVDVTTRLVVRVETTEDPQDRVLGFGLLAVDDNPEPPFGSDTVLEAVDARTQVSELGYVTHAEPIDFGADGVVTFEVDITPADDGTHRLYLVANDADGDGKSFAEPEGTSGDNVWRQRICYHIPGGPTRTLDCDQDLTEIGDPLPGSTDTGTSTSETATADTGSRPPTDVPAEAGCGCTTRPSAPWAAGVLGVLVALRRRRASRR